MNENTDLIYEQDRARLVHDGDSMVLQVQPPLTDRIYLPGMAVVMLLPTGMFFGALYVAVRNADPWLFGFTLLLFGIFPLLHCLLIVGTVQSFFVRRFSFHFNDETCLFENVPGFHLTIPFKRIDAIDLLVNQC